MHTLIAVMAAVAGYLIGSISFARIVIRMFAPEQAAQGLAIDVPGTESSFRSDVISATAVNLQLGPRYGCLTSILDMLKVVAPALVLRLWQPQVPYYLILAAMGTLGHIWPIYYRFQGGRGVSTTLGGMLVVDWIGVLVTNLIGLGVGALLPSFYVVGIPLMIPWLWFRHHDWRLVAYAAAVTLLNGIALIPEARQIVQLRRDGAMEELMADLPVRLGVASNGDQSERLTLHRMVVNLLSSSGNKRRGKPEDPSGNPSQE